MLVEACGLGEGLVYPWCAAWKKVGMMGKDLSLEKDFDGYERCCMG